MKSVILYKMSYSYMKHLGLSKQSMKQMSLLRQCVSSCTRATYTLPQRCLCTKADKPAPESPAKSSDTPTAESAGKPVEDPQRDYIQTLKETRKASQDSAKGGPSLLLMAVLGAGFIGLYFYNKARMRQHEIAVLRRSLSQSNDEVMIGGDWELTNQDGKKMTNKDFEGQWCLIYFGFTHCPDVCPDEIEKIVEVMDILGRNPELPKLRALFVTVDPDRDSPAALKNYLTEFSDKIVGLTGSWEELNKILKAFKVYFSMGPKDEDGDYVVDHSIISYLMNPQGKYEAHFARSKTNIQVANAVEKKMKNWTPKS